MSGWYMQFVGKSWLSAVIFKTGAVVAPGEGFWEMGGAAVVIVVLE